MLVALFTVCVAELDSDAEGDALDVLAEASEEDAEAVSEADAVDDDSDAFADEDVEEAVVLAVCELWLEDQGRLRLLRFPENIPHAARPSTAATSRTTT
jgi:hypothetical protein